MRTEEEAAYQAAAEAVVASEFGAEVFGLRIKSVDSEIGMEDWQGRCLRAGGVLEFRTGFEIDEYGMYAGEDALVDRIRLIGMSLLAPLAGHELLSGEPDPFVDIGAILHKIPTGYISGNQEDEDALIAGYLEQGKELLRSRWSLVQALAQRLLPRRSLNVVEIAEVLEVSGT